MADLVRLVIFLCLSFLPSSDQRQCNVTDYVQQILPCDEITLTRSVVHYLNENCSGGTTPPVPTHGIPCNCPPGKGLSADPQTKQQKCETCGKGEYGAGGEIINNWKDWTNNGTTPPEGSNIITYCELSRDYVKFCEAWKASADNYTVESGDNTLSRCLVSVLLMTRKFVKEDSTVSFDFRVDSRNCRSGYLGCDGLGFFIDSQQVLDYTGNQFQWVKKTYNLTRGAHTLKWIFRKRCYSYGYTYLDKAFIRSITLVGTAEPNVRCEQCPPGYYGNTTGAVNCTACSYFQYQSKKGQQQCDDCPPNMYAMLGASKCLPLPNCTDTIKAPGDVSTCSCESSSNLNCTTTVKPYYMGVKGFKGKARVLCNHMDPTKLNPELVQCRCQPGFEIDTSGAKPKCKKCEKGKYSTDGIKCNSCQAGHVALPGKHYYVWRNNTLPEGFTAQCAGDCSVKNGWVSAGVDIRTERVIGDVHAVLQSPEVEVDSELAAIMFNCSVTCNQTGAPHRPSREHLAKIQDCNLIFQVWSNSTVQDQLNCTHPKGTYGYAHDRKRDGTNMVHVYPLKKGKYFFSWVFHQEDDTRTLSTSFQAKVAGISILGTKDGEARNCTPCPAGYHSISGNTDCTICPNGTASPPGSKTCNPCKENSFAAQVGSETCLRCGNNTDVFPTKDGCSTNGCKFIPAEDVEYDLNKLSRPGGPMIEVLYYQPGPSPRRRRTSVIWPYSPALYVNLCTLNHDNSSCTYRDRATGTRLPRPVMACRSSWYQDTNIGSVIGYSPKEDVRSGLFVELLHGERCYGRQKNGRYRTTIDLRCDVKAGVGNPGPENNHSKILRGCEYYLVWKSLYACPKCRKGDVMKITGECVNGTRNITYVRSVPCWGTEEDPDSVPKQEKCVTPTAVTVNGTVVVAYRTRESNRVNKILIGVGVVVILVLLGVAGFFVYKHRVMKYRYYTLMARNKPMSRLAEEDDENSFIQDYELTEPLHDSLGAVRT